jgi:hypothetical protein
VSKNKIEITAAQAVLRVAKANAIQDILRAELPSSLLVRHRATLAAAEDGVLAYTTEEMDRVDDDVEFHEELFMGSMPFTGVACYVLHKRLDHALVAVSGLQQYGLQGEELDRAVFDEEKAEKDAFCEKVVRDIATALGVDLKRLVKEA